ncbi:MAG TPA: 2Fe-2S iron-sulfur cluster-binding protein [Acidimicrobiales bacterium]|nr:2Fe-2S iron-sulfur cluster-binding protein [Acidimicrobiales bacterium]
MRAAPAVAATPSADPPPLSVEFVLDGRRVVAPRDGVSLLEALREDLGEKSAKDGCAPQGQCGCCTVLVDGSPRVACVTPVRRVAGRSVTTAAGIDAGASERLIGSFLRHGASQCGFCTPGILCRLSALGPDPDPAKVETALLAHLCRCTGWRTIVDAACDQHVPGEPYGPGAGASARATLEGRTPQDVGPDIVVGGGGFADDTAPPGCLVAVPDGSGGWSVGETLAEARAASGKVQGRRSGQALAHPVGLPEGDWDLRIQTTWVEPAYLEPDASWCEPGGEPRSPVANGGAFGAKTSSLAPAAARELADRYRRPVRVVLSREDVVRLGPKRPPLSAGLHADGSGVVRVASAPGISEAIASVAPALLVEEVPVLGPPVSSRARAAGWAEAAVLLEAARALREARVPSGGAASASAEVAGPGGGWARATVAVDADGWPSGVDVVVRCGPVLDEVTMRSYATGAAHMALGWVCSEAIAVGEDGVPDDLTIRSFGVLRARDTPPIRVGIDEDRGAAGEPVNGSDAVFAAVAAAVWIAQGLPFKWPTRRGGHR